MNVFALLYLICNSAIEIGTNPATSVTNASFNGSKNLTLGLTFIHFG